MYSNSFRKFYINVMLSNVADIADREYQKRVWIRAEGPEMDDFDDSMCEGCKFVRRVLEERDSFKLSDKEFEILDKFYNIFFYFQGSIYTLENVDDPKWITVTEVAGEVLKVFGYLGRDKFARVPQLSVEERNQWLQDFFRNISHIADENYQERIWIRKEDSEESSYENVRDDFFADSLGFLKYANIFGFTELQTIKLEQFRKFFGNFDDRFGISIPPASEFIRSLEWKGVMEKAKELLESFHYPTSNHSNQ